MHIRTLLLSNSSPRVFLLGVFSSREVTAYAVTHWSIFVTRKNFTTPKAIRRLTGKWHRQPVRSGEGTYALGKLLWMWCKVKNTWRGASEYAKVCVNRECLFTHRCYLRN